MCNRYASDRRKLGIWGADDEWSETRIKIDFPKVADEIFPDKFALVGRLEGNRIAPAAMRWGLPGPTKFGALPVTNVRNLKSPHWRPYLKREHRCVVPFTSFSEYEDASPKGKKVLRWFTPTTGDVAMFAGIWRTWRGLRGTKAEKEADGEIEHHVFSFLTTGANEVVRPIHEKAMPVILTTAQESDFWLNGSDADVLAFQERVLPNEALRLEELAVA